jgi:hypothetical protein
MIKRILILLILFSSVHSSNLVITNLQISSIKNADTLLSNGNILKRKILTIQTKADGFGFANFLFYLSKDSGRTWTDKFEYMDEKYDSETGMIKPQPLNQLFQVKIRTAVNGNEYISIKAAARQYKSKLKKQSQIPYIRSDIGDTVPLTLRVDYDQTSNSYAFTMLNKFIWINNLSIDSTDSPELTQSTIIPDYRKKENKQLTYFVKSYDTWNIATNIETLYVELKSSLYDTNFEIGSYRSDLGCAIDFDSMKTYTLGQTQPDYISNKIDLIYTYSNSANVDKFMTPYYAKICAYPYTDYWPSPNQSRFYRMVPETILDSFYTIKKLRNIWDPRLVILEHLAVEKDAVYILKTNEGSVVMIQILSQEPGPTGKIVSRIIAPVE